MKGLFILLLSFPTIFNAQKTIYVNAVNSGGIQDGTSWATAFSDLKVALDSAAYNDQIWVAKGIYRPTEQFDRAVSFVLKNGIKLYGGFEGSETTLVQRDFELNVTLLTGELGAPGAQDNSYHVLWGQGLDHNTVLDGFVIANGNANGAYPHASGGGLALWPSQDVINTDPTILNCRFERNYAIGGAAIACERNLLSGDNFVNPILRNCDFSHNRSVLSGGGVLKIGSSFEDEPFLIENCVFTSNSSRFGEGGGLYIKESEGATLLINCVFDKDTSLVGLGGGVYFEVGYEEQRGGQLYLESCRFEENQAAQGGAFCQAYFGVNSFASPEFFLGINKCKFLYNRSVNGPGGAFFSIAYERNRMKVEMLNSDLIGNTTNGYGIATVVGKSENQIELVVKNCNFFDNHRVASTENGTFPLLYGIEGQGGKFNAFIENCVFSRNEGGISTPCSSLGGQLRSIISNCTFYDNNWLIINKSYHPHFNGVDNYVEIFVENCIIWEPGIGLYEMFSDNDLTMNHLGGYYINNCLLSLLPVHIINNPQEFGNNMITQQAPLFQNAALDDYQLMPCSPGVNQGNNLIVDTLQITTDMAGNPRVLFGRVDMGAFEATDSCVVSVNREPSSQPEELDVFPNPTHVSGKFRMLLPSPALDGEHVPWIVWTTQGQKISSGILDLHGQAWAELDAPKQSGVFYVQLRCNERWFIGLVLVQN